MCCLSFVLVVAAVLLALHPQRGRFFNEQKWKNWQIKIAFVIRTSDFSPFSFLSVWPRRWLDWLCISNAIMMRITNIICFILLGRKQRPTINKTGERDWKQSQSGSTTSSNNGKRQRTTTTTKIEWMNETNLTHQQLLNFFWFLFFVMFVQLVGSRIKEKLLWIELYECRGNINGNVKRREKKRANRDCFVC